MKFADSNTVNQAKDDMSDTRETEDARVDNPDLHAKSDYVHVVFARKLERERNELRKVAHQLYLALCNDGMQANNAISRFAQVSALKSYEEFAYGKDKE